MPLKPGYSEATVHANIGTLILEGHPSNQASAIALEHGRAAYFQRYPQGLLPVWLKLPGGRRDRASWDAYRRANPGGCGCSVDEEMYRARPSRRKTNPVPESSRSAKRNRQARIAAASDLYTRFTGHDASERVVVDKPEFPDTLLAIGDIDGILYTTVRDGRVEKYIHKFKQNCRPLFCVSHDGKQIILLGGSYDFTERGIVDRSKS